MQSLLIRRYVCFAFVLLCLGCQQSLTRSDAQSLISANKDFSKQQYDTFWIGHVTSLYEFQYEYLEKAGYVRIARTDAGEGQVILTGKGRDAIRQCGGRIDDRLVTVPSGKQEIISVNGMSIDGKTAVADFDWQWKFDEIGAVLNPLDNRVVRKGRAYFRLYDDGWRLMSVNYPR